MNGCFKKFLVHKRNLAGIAVGLYVAAMVAVSGIMIAGAFEQGRTVRIDDRETLLHRNTAAIPVSLEVQDLRWGTAEVEDREEMLEISQRVHRIPVSERRISKQDRPILSGKITYIDGKSDLFSLGGELLYRNSVSHSKNSLFDLCCAVTMLEKQVYTVENLADFFVPENNVVLISEQNRASISPGNIEALRQKIAGGAAVEAAELDYAIRSRGMAKYVISVKKLDEPGGWLFLSVYGNDYNEVYDVQSGKGMVLSLSCDLLPFCQKLMGKLE